MLKATKTTTVISLFAFLSKALAVTLAWMMHKSIVSCIWALLFGFFYILYQGCFHQEEADAAISKHLYSSTAVIVIDKAEESK